MIYEKGQLKWTELKTQYHKDASKVLGIPFSKFNRFNTFVGRVNHNRPKKPEVKPKLPKLTPPERLAPKKSNNI